MTLRMLAGLRSRPEKLDERARADGLAVGDVALDQRLQQELRALVQHGIVCRHAVILQSFDPAPTAARTRFSMGGGSGGNMF